MSNSEKDDSDRFLKEKEFNQSGGVDLSKFLQEDVLNSEEKDDVASRNYYYVLSRKDTEDEEGEGWLPAEVPAASEPEEA